MRNDSETNSPPAESRDLRCIAGMMIPASAEFGVPGADDAIIFADIVSHWAATWAMCGRLWAGCCELAGGASPIWTRRGGRRWRRRCRAGRRGGCGDALAGDPAMLLSRRPRGALAGSGAAAAVSEGAHAGAGRLVAARSGADAAEDVARRGLMRVSISRGSAERAGIGSGAFRKSVREPVAGTHVGRRPRNSTRNCAGAFSIMRAGIRANEETNVGGWHSEIRTPGVLRRRRWTGWSAICAK